MKQANPKCYILGGSVSNMWTESYKWQSFCFKKGILSSGIDAWSVHPYGVGRAEDYIEAYDIVRKLASDAGAKMLPMLNTERGFPISKKGEGFGGGEEGKLQYEYQAWHLVRQYLIDQLCDIKLTSWYELGGTEGFASTKAMRSSPPTRPAKSSSPNSPATNSTNASTSAPPRISFLRYVSKNGSVKTHRLDLPPQGRFPRRRQAA